MTPPSPEHILLVAIRRALMLASGAIEKYLDVSKKQDSGREKE